MSSINFLEKVKNGWKSFILKVKRRWNIESDWQLFIIFIVFGVTGSLSVKVGQPILEFLSITKASLGVWLYYPARIMITLPVYQFLLIIIGSALGQFRFFWNFEKKMFGRFIPSGKKAN